MSNSVFLKPDENGNWGSVSLSGSSSTGADGVAATTSATSVINYPMLYNGTTFDTQRSNYSVTALSLAARTGSTTTSDFVNYNARGIIVYFYITVVGSTGNLLLAVEGKNALGTSQYRQINTSYTAATGAGMQAFIIYPGASANANFNRADPVPLAKVFRFSVIPSDLSTTWTYSVAFDFIM